MLAPELITYEDARLLADENQHKIVAAIPVRLVDKEDHFLERILKAKAGPQKKLEILYSLMDELAEVMDPFTPCKKGCAACCHYGVSISTLEVAYIEKHTRHRRLKKGLESQDFHGEPCPFLTNDMCSIYAARPFVCRRHNALTPNSYWCHPERSDRPFPKIGFTNINLAFEVIRQEANAREPSDIRQYFGRASV